MSRLCTWCGHPPHDDECPRSIQTANGKSGPTTKPCPCAYRREP